jgi:AIG2-like family
MLHDHALCFPAHSEKRAGGVASIREEEGSMVWGALYDLTLEDLEEMDGIEGRKTNPRRPATVEVPGVGEVTAWLYQYSGKHQHHEPGEAYLRQILEGCATWGLPAAYIRMVKKVAKGQPDSARAATVR